MPDGGCGGSGGGGREEIEGVGSVGYGRPPITPGCLRDQIKYPPLHGMARFRCPPSSSKHPARRKWTQKKCGRPVYHIYFPSTSVRVQKRKLGLSRLLMAQFGCFLHRAPSPASLQLHCLHPVEDHKAMSGWEWSGWSLEFSCKNTLIK